MHGRLTGDVYLDFTTTGALALATFIFVVTPGPGIVALLSRTMARGIGAGLLIGLGLIMGDFIYLLAVLVSLQTAADIVAPYMGYVRIIGAGFLCYIGYRQWVSPPITAEQARARDAGRRHSIWQTLVAGIAISGTNPKVMVFYLSFLPQFIDLSAVTLRDGIIVCVTIALTLFAGCLVYGIGADRIYRLIKDEAGARLVNRITGGSIIAVAAVMVTTI